MRYWYFCDIGGAFITGGADCLRYAIPYRCFSGIGGAFITRGADRLRCAIRYRCFCGISGAFHFVVGIEKADMVIAINSDPQAAIFEYADYCIVGDVNQIIPDLLAALKQEVSYA